MYKDFNTIEEVEKALAENEQKEKAGGAQKAGAADKVNNSDLCILYAKWGPVLKFAASLIFFKPAWQKGFRIFIQALETNCDITDTSL